MPLTGSAVLLVTGSAIGLAIAIEQGRALVRCLASRDWREAEGRVLTAQAISHHMWRGITLGNLQFRYAYRVDGTLYEGHRYSLTGFTPTQGGAQSVARTFEPGTRITVWYNPARPAEAVVDRGDPQVPFVLGIAGLMLLAICVWVLLVVPLRP